MSTTDFHNIINSLENFVSCEDLVKKKKSFYKVAITFDDGLSDVYYIAYPFLKEHGIPFTIFVVNDFLDTEGYITTDQLKEMSNDSLVTIGAHGISHVVLTKLASEQKWIEIYESKIKLEELLNKQIHFFAYSHGQYDAESLEMVEKAGYKAAFGVDEFPVNFYSGNWTFHLPRFNVIEQEIGRINDIIYRWAHK